MERLHDRKTVAIDAVLETSSGLRESRIRDLSMGGCYVESMTSFTPGEPVAFDLIDTAGCSVGFTGEVAYVLEGFGFGLRFTNISPEQLKFLHEAIPKQ
jgi:hypothetical protein